MEQRLGDITPNSLRALLSSLEPM